MKGMKGNLREGKNGEIIHNPGLAHKIDKLWAVMVEDEKGNNGIIAMGKMDEQTKEVVAYPMVTGDPEELEFMKTEAVNRILPEAQAEGLVVKVYEFSERTAQPLLSSSKTQAKTTEPSPEEMLEPGDEVKCENCGETHKVDELHPETSKIMDSFMASLPDPTKSKENREIVREVMEIASRLSVTAILCDEETTGLDAVLESAFHKRDEAKVKSMLGDLGAIFDQVNGESSQSH